MVKIKRTILESQRGAPKSLTPVKASNTPSPPPQSKPPVRVVGAPVKSKPPLRALVPPENVRLALGNRVRLSNKRKYYHGQEGRPLPIDFETEHTVIDLDMEEGTHTVTLLCRFRGGEKYGKLRVIEPFPFKVQVDKGVECYTKHTEADEEKLHEITFQFWTEARLLIFKDFIEGKRFYRPEVISLWRKLIETTNKRFAEWTELLFKAAVKEDRFPKENERNERNERNLAYPPTLSRKTDTKQLQNK